MLGHYSDSLSTYLDPTILKKAERQTLEEEFMNFVSTQNKMCLVHETSHPDALHFTITR